MDDAAQKTWDVRLKVIGLVALIVSGSWTLWRYGLDREEDREHSRAEAVKSDDAKTAERNRFIFERQTAIFLDASQTASRFASTNDAHDREQAKIHFEELHHGNMIVVEDVRVYAAMLVMSGCMDDYPKPCHRIGVNRFDQVISDDMLRRLHPPTPKYLAAELSTCIRESLEESRRINFGDLNPEAPPCPYD